MQKVVEQRCLLCHGAQVQMKSVRLDSPQEIASHAQAIYQQVVVSRVMPMSNSTGMTDDERALIDTWFRRARPRARPAGGNGLLPLPFCPRPFNPSSLASMHTYDATLPYPATWPATAAIRRTRAGRARASPCSSC